MNVTKAKKAELSRQEILNVAARMMAEKGYDRMSLRDLASEVGMKAGSLYYHFPSKDSLASEVMRLGVEGVAGAVGAALAANPHYSARNRLVLAMSTHLDMLLSASDFSSAHIRCYPFVPDRVRSELTLVRRDYDRVWNEIIAQYLQLNPEADQVRQLRHMILGALNWSLEWFDPERDDAASYVDSIAGLLPANND